MEPEMITIPKMDYDKLIKDQLILRALYSAGVDNWEGYDIALEYIEEDKPRSDAIDGGYTPINF
jgi:hypothetical protein